MTVRQFCSRTWGCFSHTLSPQRSLTGFLRLLLSRIGPRVSPPPQRQDLPQPAADTSPSRAWLTRYETPAPWQDVFNVAVFCGFIILDYSALLNLAVLYRIDGYISIYMCRCIWLGFFLFSNLWSKAASDLRVELLGVHNSSYQLIPASVRSYPHSRSSDASRRCDRPAELVCRLLLRLLRGEDPAVFHRELRDLSGGNLSAVSFLVALCSQSGAFFACSNDNSSGYYLQCHVGGTCVLATSLVRSLTQACLCPPQNFSMQLLCSYVSMCFSRDDFVRRIWQHSSRTSGCRSRFPSFSLPLKYLPDALLICSNALLHPPLAVH